MMRKKIKVLCFLDFFYPAYKAGGPIKTISGMVENLNKDLDFYIITRNYDLNSKKPFNNLKSNEWNSVKGVKVYYISRNKLMKFNLFNLLLKTPHDIVYFNSFFSFLFTGHILILIKLLNIKSKMILAPRGEFSDGALSIKSFKKNIYLNFFRIFRLGKNIIWQASSIDEKKDIIKSKISKSKNIFIAPNLTSVKVSSNYLKPNYKESKCLKLVFIARISKVKNLTFLLKLLFKINKKVSLTIYGPIEDKYYWNKCNEIIKKLPNNINVKYAGELKSTLVFEEFKKYDLFVFPTLGENFGHVIIESLSVGTCVLTSNKTPWKNSPGVKTLDLNNPNKWVNEINKWINFSSKQLIIKRKDAHKFAEKYFNINDSYIKNLELFNYTMNQ